MENKNLHKPIPIGALVMDPSTKRLAMILDYVPTSEWGRVDMDNPNRAGIIYGMLFVDGVGPPKTFRYGYEIKVLSGKYDDP